MTVATDGRGRTLLFSDQNGGVYGVDAAAAARVGKRASKSTRRRA